MTVDERIKDLMQQKQVCKQANRKRTFEEYKAAMREHIRNIDGELFLMFHTLAEGLNERQTAELDGVIKDFTQQLNALTEKIKDCYY